jgi:hypothetical protein
MGENLEWWRQGLEESKKWFIRLYGDKCRAILSQEYCPVGNEQMLEWLQEYTAGYGKLIQSWLDPDTLHIKVIFANQSYGSRKGGTYGFGVYVGNGEIGNRRVRVLPLIQRSACANSIIIAEGGYTQVHRFRTPLMVEAHIREALMDSLRVATERIDDLWKAAMDELPDFTTVVANLCKAKGLSPEVKDKVLLGSEGAQTRLGVINGLTWAAHEQPDVELRIDMETLAGGILVNRDTLFGRAALAHEMAEAERED